MNSAIGANNNRLGHRFEKFLAAWRKDRSGPISGSWGNSAVLVAALALAYFGCGILAVTTTSPGSVVTSQVFFAEGIALALAIMFGPRVAPGVFLGQFFIGQASGLPLDASTIIALVNAGGIALGGLLFWRLRISPSFDRPREIFLFVALSALILQPISATGGVLTHHLLAAPLEGSMVITLISWWMANCLGQVLVVPLVFSWLRRSTTSDDRKEHYRALLIASVYLIPLILFLNGEWGAVTPFYRFLLVSVFYLPLVAIAVTSSVRTVAFVALLLVVPFVFLIHVGPGLSNFFSDPVRYFCANTIIFSAVVTALLIAALHEQLMARSRQLHEAIVTRERILAVIGHDLRGPVGILKTYLDLMIDGVLSPDEFREIQHELRNGVGQTFDALETLLEWANAETSSTQPRITAVNLRSRIGEASELLSLTADRKEISITNSVPAEAWVNGDEHQLQCVFRNLLSNAIKFTAKGGAITVSADKADGQWRINFRDTGVGMRAERAASLFQPGTDCRSTRGTANETGLGLGLQLCQKFVHANHGTIMATSEPQVGTTIHVTLPATLAPITQSQEDEPDDGPGGEISHDLPVISGLEQ